MDRPKTFSSIVIFLTIAMALALSRLEVASPSRASSLLGSCPSVQGTPLFTIAYGTVTANGVSAAIGTVVEARSPRGDVVGCFVVETAGYYGAVYVYGQDTSAEPLIPGMRGDESVAFYVDGIAAAAAPTLVWGNDHEPHEVNLAAESAIRGDVNGDGLVNSTDALIVLSADAGLNTAAFCPMNCGDVNTDGWINSTDALIILTYDAGLPVGSLPVGQPGCPAEVAQPPGCGG